MAETTGIGWCDATFNPWWGCEKVSPACAHCYAERDSNRYGHEGLWGEGHSFRWLSEANWAKPLSWARTMPHKLGRRPRVFTASMADVFEERPELEQPRRRLFDLIEKTPELDWLVLTKRPEAALRWFDEEWPSPEGSPWLWTPPLANVWMGVSIENVRFTWRADILREIPASVRFISAEPLLGSLFESRPAGRVSGGGTAGSLPQETGSLPGTYRCRDLDEAFLAGAPDDVIQEGIDFERAHFNPDRAPLNLDNIDWVISGGESGPKHRESKAEWFRELRDECRAREIPYFFKQWGGLNPKSLGKTLDGREWCEFPESRMPEMVLF